MENAATAGVVLILVLLTAIGTTSIVVVGSMATLYHPTHASSSHSSLGDDNREQMVPRDKYSKVEEKAVRSSGFYHASPRLQGSGKLVSPFPLSSSERQVPTGADPIHHHHSPFLRPHHLP